MKHCPRCGEDKPRSDFFRDKSRKDGLRHICKPCATSMNRRWRKEHCDFGGYNRNSQLKLKFGITLEDYKRMHEAQQGRCAVCGNEERELGRTRKVKQLAVDHCHKTGAVRALLCGPCNRSIGMMNDDPALLRLAAAYVESFRTS